MKKIKAGLRLLVTVLLLLLAVFGVGITGNFLDNTRERYREHKTKTEHVSKREDEG